MPIAAGWFLPGLFAAASVALSQDTLRSDYRSLSSVHLSTHKHLHDPIQEQFPLYRAKLIKGLVYESWASSRVESINLPWLLRVDQSCGKRRSSWWAVSLEHRWREWMRAQLAVVLYSGKVRSIDSCCIRA